MDKDQWYHSGKDGEISLSADEEVETRLRLS